MPMYPPREPIVDPAVHRAGRLSVLLVLATVMAVVIVGYVVYRALFGR